MNQLDERIEYEYRYEPDSDFALITKMFPDAKFQIGIPPYKLDNLITNKTLIIIKQVFNCDCYDMCIQEPKYFVIAGTCITSEYIIHELIKQGYKIDCKHVFIEGFEQSIDIDYQFNIIQSS
jgi:hypothetical protein|uniref:Uncharacterized protein n=1 Tax=viral metagenome TaxID=1070528 RepID=A0A6C0IXY2_9ZZZZ